MFIFITVCLGALCPFIGLCSWTPCGVGTWLPYSGTGVNEASMTGKMPQTRALVSGNHKQDPRDTEKFKCRNQCS
jgi:hypothetical protein